MTDRSSDNRWLRDVLDGQTVNTSYYLAQDVASEVIEIIKAAMEAGKTVSIAINDDNLRTAIDNAIDQHQLQVWRCRGGHERLPVTTIARWRSLLKSDNVEQVTPSTTPHPVLAYMRARYVPIYQNYSWTDLQKIMDKASPVIRLSHQGISGDAEEYRLLRRTVRRMAQIWHPQFQALLALQLFGRAFSAGEQRLKRQLNSWYQDLLTCLVDLEDTISDHHLQKATRLDSNPTLQEVLHCIGDLYQRINESEVLAFRLEDTAHYAETIRKYAVDVCSRLRLGLDILNSEAGFLQWLHNYHRLDKNTQTIIDGLRLYPAEQWDNLLESWYISEVLKMHPVPQEVPTTDDWAAMWHSHISLQNQSMQARQQAVARRCKDALARMTQADQTLTHQLLRIEADQVDLTYGDIVDRHPDLVRHLWTIDVPAAQANIVISDTEVVDHIGGHYHITKQGERLAQPLLVNNGLITALPIAQRLPLARALAYHLSLYGTHLHLLMLKGKLVVSTIGPKTLAQIITSLGRQFIRESDIHDKVADITDHLLATDVDVEIWIEGPMIDNRRYTTIADQYHLLGLLKASGYTIKDAEQLAENATATDDSMDQSVYDLPTEHKDLQRQTHGGEHISSESDNRV